MSVLTLFWLQPQAYHCPYVVFRKFTETFHQFIAMSKSSRNALQLLYRNISTQQNMSYRFFKNDIQHCSCKPPPTTAVFHRYTFVHVDISSRHLDLWLSFSNQVILKSKWMSVPDVMKFPSGIPDILHSQQHEVTWPWPLDLWPTKSNQCIFES